MSRNFNVCTGRCHYRSQEPKRSHRSHTKSQRPARIHLFQGTVLYIDTATAKQSSQAFKSIQSLSTFGVRIFSRGVTIEVGLLSRTIYGICVSVCMYVCTYVCIYCRMYHVFQTSFRQKNNSSPVHCTWYSTSTQYILHFDTTVVIIVVHKTTQQPNNPTTKQMNKQTQKTWSVFCPGK